MLGLRSTRCRDQCSGFGRAETGLRGVASGGGLGLVGGRHPLGRTGLVVVAMSELIATGALADVEPLPRARDDPHAAAIAYLRADDGWFRVDVDAAARGLWSPASVMAAGFDVPQGTGNPMEIVVYNQFYWGIAHKGMPAYNALGAKYVIVPKDGQPGADGIWPVFLDDPLVDVHLNTNALPRAWLVYRVTPVDTLEAAFATVLSPEFVPFASATVTMAEAERRGPRSDRGAGLRPQPRCVQRDLDHACAFRPQRLALPGLAWTRQRQPTTTMRQTGFSRGVPASGHSRVEMHYFPASLQVGLGLMACGCWSARPSSGMRDHGIERRAQDRAAALSARGRA